MRDTTAGTRWMQPLALGVGLLVLAFALGAWTFSRGNVPFTLDAWWNLLLHDASTPVLTAFSQAMNWLGGGWFAVFAMPLGGTLALVLLRRPWAAGFFLGSSAASAGLVQVLKHLWGRARPEDIIVVTDYGSFPSGHVANAATLAAAAVFLFSRYWVVVAGVVWVLLMAFSRTYLHAHWLSDTLGGALVGVGSVCVVAAAFAVPLAREGARRSRGRALPGAGEDARFSLSGGDRERRQGGMAE